MSGGDRSWAAIDDNAQQLPSGLRVMAAPARAAQAHTAVGEAARGFAGLLAAAPDVVTVADCGRVESRCAAVGGAGAAHAAARSPVGGVGAGDGPSCRSGDRGARRAAQYVPPGRRRAHRRRSVPLVRDRRRRSAPSCSACFPRMPPARPSSPADGPSASGHRAAHSPRRRRRSANASSRRSTGAITDPSSCGLRRPSDDACAATPTDRPDVRRAARRPAPPTRASGRRHRRQARRPQGPGVAQRRLADVARRREGRLGHRDPPRARRVQRGHASAAGCRRCRTTPTRPCSTP